MADEFDWDEFEGNKWTAKNVGDKIKGKITALEVKEGRNGRYPVLVVQVNAQGDTREIGASAADLKQQLAAIRPQVGWMISIEMTGTRQTGQPSPMKLFDVRVKQPEPAPVVEGFDVEELPDDEAPF